MPAISRALSFTQLRINASLEAPLLVVKYIVLAAILAAALTSSALAKRFAEIEPFKTAITLMFVRSLQFLIYAAGLLVGGLFVYKSPVVSCAL